jgi:hypothetical protein
MEKKLEEAPQVKIQVFIRQQPYHYERVLPPYLSITSPVFRAIAKNFQL